MMVSQMRPANPPVSPNVPEPSATPVPGRLSTLLLDIAERHGEAGERLSLGELIDTLGNRAFGALLFVFALPVAIPIPIPGISAILGAPILLLSWQLMRGQDQPWLPEFMRSRSFDRNSFNNLLHRVVPWMRRIECFVGPRLSSMATGHAERMIGFLACLFALILFLPIPFGNTVPSLSIAVLALAILERDGIATFIGTLIGLLGLVLVSGVIFGIGFGVIEFFQAHFLGEAI